MPSVVQVSVAALAALPTALCWGATGHAVVATIAESYLTSTAKTFVSGLLGSSSIVDVASWADDYRYTSAGSYSAGYHYIDANDSPPSSCSVSLSRDCDADAGCIVAAISNYTTKVMGSGTTANRAMALKFIVHFLGDIHQPLHDEALKVGGNSIDVLWNGADTNLHHAWDTEMVEELAGGYSDSIISSFAASLVKEINSGTYASQAASWITCDTPADASKCALAWATEANKINCAYVLKTDETSKELSGSYYTGAKPYIKQQLARAGYRLGNWLNAIAKDA